MPLEPPLRNDSLTQRCAICERPFPHSGRRVFCSATCRQTAWRRRHPIPLPSIPLRTPRHHTVYQCPECDSRYLGEQYCSECGRFCRRVGAGGLCPTCEEPVAMSDLLPEYAEPAGGGAPPPNPLTPGAFGTPNYQNGGDLSKPKTRIPGNSSGRHRAGPLAAIGRISGSGSNLVQPTGFAG